MMIVDHQNALDLNVHIVVLNEKEEKVNDLHFKNTATERMTRGIAMFLAGDEATYENRTKLDSPASGLGRWRPNFVSFATTGIDEQPKFPGGTATVNDIIAFENTNPEPGNRTRPWYQSKYLGEHTDGLWNPEVGWATDPNDPTKACFQGELAVDPRVDPDSKLKRHQILRADITTDNSNSREAGKNGYSTDCILYGFTSVLWTKDFFNPPNGPSVPRIAISEFGLYESNSDSYSNMQTLMAGFRVPRVSDIVYVEPGYVILVEWRITIRALMPYEVVGEGSSTGGYASMGVTAHVTDAQHIAFTANLYGGLSQDAQVDWTMTGDATLASGTTLTPLIGLNQARLVIDAQEPSTVLMITVTCLSDTDLFVTFPVFVEKTRTVTIETTWKYMGVIMTPSASALIAAGITLEDNQVAFTINGQNIRSQTGQPDYVVTLENVGQNWLVEGATSVATTFTQPSTPPGIGVLTIGDDEESLELTISAVDTTISERRYTVMPVRRLDYTIKGYRDADIYSNAKTYAVKDVVVYNGILYICKIAVTIAESFDSSKWEAITNVDGVLYMQPITEAAYEALVTKDSRTLYILEG